MAAVSIPKTMKGVQIENFGGPEVLQYKTDLPVAVPRDGEVLVKNGFIGINYVDVFVTLLPCLDLNFSDS
jgi:NADPH:quinone reductase